MDSERRKTVAPIGRPVFTQSSSSQDSERRKTVAPIRRPVCTQSSSSQVIKGVSAESVTRASERMQVNTDKAVKSPNLDYSHFVSLPLAVHPELVDKLLNFQKTILENLDGDSSGDTSKVNITSIHRGSYPTRSLEPSALGIDKSIFIKPTSLHLTVLMLNLWNKDRVDAAAEVLQSVSSKVLEALHREPVSVRLKGLDCMRGTVPKAHVLYIPVEEIGSKGRLSHACQVIIDAFVEAGLVLEKDSQRKLKLHATVMNAKFRKWGRGTRNLDSFDARGIFKQFGSQEWGKYLIREAHLSQRFAYDENGYYRCCASIPFPKGK